MVETMLLGAARPTFFPFEPSLYTVVTLTMSVHVLYATRIDDVDSRRCFGAGMGVGNHPVNSTWRGASASC